MNNYNTRIIDNDFDPEIVNSNETFYILIGTERFNTELDNWLNDDTHSQIKQILQQYYGDTSDKGVNGF